jgi:hypothetical protein
MFETPGDVPAGAAKAGDKTGGDRIVHARHDDRDGLRQLLHRPCRENGCNENHGGA